MKQAYTIEKRIRDHRLFDVSVEWSHEVIFPYYNGLSIHNITRSIAQLLGANNLTSSPLDNLVWDNVLPQVERILLFVSDGLGYNWLQQLIAEDDEIRDAVAFLSDERGSVPLTSCVPSTTTAALPTFWTGTPPGTHGMLGSQAFLREVSMLVKLLHFVPVGGEHNRGVIFDWGFDPATFLPVPTISEVLAEVAVPTHLLTHRNLLGTGLSRIMHRGVTHTTVHGGGADFWILLEELLESTAGQHCYLHAYLDNVDTLSHLHGSRTHYLQSEIRTQLTHLQRIVSNPAVQDGKTLILFAADHGHRDIHHNLQLHLDEKARPIYEAMRMSTGGTGRLNYLYLREGSRQQVIDTIENHFADCLTWFDGLQSLESGLFGNHMTHPEAKFRIGDIVLVIRQGWSTNDQSRKNTPRSRHGGLMEDEMLVPLLWKQI
ncbi:MAG: alkaline phosphatase family protein [Chloroflexi bacterium]|nr:alkaline phosphatase family protein [Chloroflexota bacterium]